MGTRRIEIEYRDIEDAPGIHLNFDGYGVILYYAFTVNKQKAFQFYKAIANNYRFKHNYNLPILPDENPYDGKVYLSISQLPEVIDFIKNEIIPSLQALPISWNAIKAWNVGNSFESFLGSKGDFFVNFGIDEIDLNGWSKENLIYYFERLQQIFEYAVANNVMYTYEVD